MTRVLLIGAGRMGLRHLRGVALEADGIVVVYHNTDVEKPVREVLQSCGYEGSIDIVPSIDQAADMFDAAILTATAAGRAQRFEKILELDIRHILLEKPLEQSRAQVLHMKALADQVQSDIRCNHVFRENSLFKDIRDTDAPLQMTVNAGAIGLGCGGVHWIDLALYLTKANSGKLVSGGLDDFPIASGRGGQFKDYGGFGLFKFDDGSTLSLHVDAKSSAAAVCVITQAHRQLVIDLLEGVWIHEREKSSELPNYLYGQGYHTRSDEGFLLLEAAELTRQWLLHAKGERTSKLPTLGEAVTGHELLFDLLETGGDKVFPVT